MSKRLAPNDAAAVRAFLKHHVPMFGGVPDAALREFASHAFYRRCPAGEYVCRSGDRALEVSIVQNGRLLVNQQRPGGNLHSISLLMPGDIAGLMAVASPIYLWDVVVSRNALLIVVPLAPMLRLIDQSPAVARAVLNGYGRRLQHVETLLYYSREHVEKRLILTLIHLHQKFGPIVPLTRRELGQLAGTTPETAMRLLRRLEERKLLQRRRGDILIKSVDELKAGLGLDSGRL